jgi:hypothetical protein
METFRLKAGAPSFTLEVRRFQAPSFRKPRYRKNVDDYAPYITLVLLVLVLVAADAIIRRVRLALLPAVERDLLERAKNTLPVTGTALEERGALKGCSNCRIPSITLPYRDRSGRTYCSQECIVWSVLGPTGFCERCVNESLDQSLSDLSRINGIGKTFGGKSERCVQCLSTVRRIWFTFLFVPVLPLARYRVIHASPTQFWSRKLR